MTSTGKRSCGSSFYQKKYCLENILTVQYYRFFRQLGGCCFGPGWNRGTPNRQQIHPRKLTWRAPKMMGLGKGDSVIPFKHGNFWGIHVSFGGCQSSRFFSEIWTLEAFWIGSEIWIGFLFQIGTGYGYVLGCPPSQDSSHHQDYETFFVGDPYKPSFATVTGRGDNPSYVHQKLSRNKYQSCLRDFVQMYRQLPVEKTCSYIRIRIYIYIYIHIFEIIHI